MVSELDKKLQEALEETRRLREAKEAADKAAENAKKQEGGN